MSDGRNEHQLREEMRKKSRSAMMSSEQPCRDGIDGRS
jgi:hypothetical protein